ncbi:hypothetical protein [Azonexus fungiphilus]|jgi:hypothetical protein|uniref:hypothetical protein n=1 Tax=Azonexus fungiphilus TaxID=146940 RepID=UPI001475813A|nr:hypothetical protein [Azonexus fungiphilus]NHC07719.1 hypothetical protein [Azonexus fungiphilus]
MNTGWLIFGLCALTLIGATLPLLHERRQMRRKDDQRPPASPTEEQHGITPDRSGNQDQLH